jgi:hypothetical protein
LESCVFTVVNTNGTAGLEFVVLGEAVDTIVTGTPYPSP